MSLLLLLLFLQPLESFAFVVTISSCSSSSKSSIRKTHLFSASPYYHDSVDGNVNGDRRPLARLLESSSPETADSSSLLITALERAGFDVVASDFNDDDDDDSTAVAVHRCNAATGMLQLVSSSHSSSDSNSSSSPPRWIPMVQEQETVLVKNGWSFLDVDESEKLSPFDIDAANQEGSYQPQWKQQEHQQQSSDDSNQWYPSELGFDLTPLSEAQILDYAETRLRSVLSRRVLLEGATDPPGVKQTHNGHILTGSVTNIEPGIFICALSGLPLFATTDLSPASTASSGWLSFVRPISQDHVILVEPKPGASDSRTEVVCAKSKCHLGHYFGPGEGYCINASVLDYLRVQLDDAETLFSYMSPPVSYRSLEQRDSMNSPSIRLSKELLGRAITAATTTSRSDDHLVCAVVLGAGCFWHIETALRRLPGVIDTTVGYAGGQQQSLPPPTYEQVCQGTTGHAEVVRVTFHPSILAPRVLLDCFLSLHDPTKVRAHGKHARGTGQYRSCIFLSAASSTYDDDNLVSVARQALMDCQTQLGKELSTELRIVDGSMDEWFFPAEERHQRHDEQKQEKKGIADTSMDLSTLSADEWLEVYGKRRNSILGSAQTL